DYCCQVWDSTSDVLF
nr:immunoglobulin light chain junction region [Macaca mulatta]